MTSLDDTAGLFPPDENASPMEAAVGVENAAIVSEAVAKLPEQQRMVVTLRIWGGMSYAEIASSAGRTEATIRSHMHRALESLRSSLSPVLMKE